MCLGKRLDLLPRGRSSSISPFTAWRVWIPLSWSIFQNGISIWPTVAASSLARWWSKAGRPRCSATISSLYFPSPGSRFWARMRESM